MSSNSCGDDNAERKVSYTSVVLDNFFFYFFFSISLCWAPSVKLSNYLRKLKKLFSISDLESIEEFNGIQYKY